MRTKGSLGEALDSINNTIDTANRAGEEFGSRSAATVHSLNTPSANDAYNDGDWQTLSDRLDIFRRQAGLYSGD